MTRPRRPGEVVLAEVGWRADTPDGESYAYQPEAFLSVPLKDTAAETAKAWVAALVDLFDVQTAERALRGALRSRAGRSPGRRQRPASHALSSLLLAEYDGAMRRGLNATHAKGYVVELFSGEDSPFAGEGSPFGPARAESTVERRLEGLLAERRRTRGNP
ncbi:MAG: hypothetical protein JWP73_697 [Phenylobacterium sp.]|nr:hypothetical protein [Phenylobacterium sp.]